MSWLFWGKPFSDKIDYKFTLTDSYFEQLSDTSKVLDLFNSILNSNFKTVELDFSNCTSISVTGTTILAALGPLLNTQKRKIKIEYGNNENIINRFSITPRSF